MPRKRRNRPRPQPKPRSKELRSLRTNLRKSLRPDPQNPHRTHPARPRLRQILANPQRHRRSHFRSKQQPHQHHRHQRTRPPRLRRQRRTPLRRLPPRQRSRNLRIKPQPIRHPIHRRHQTPIHTTTTRINHEPPNHQRQRELRGHSSRVIAADLQSARPSGHTRLGCTNLTHRCGNDGKAVIAKHKRSSSPAMSGNAEKTKYSDCTRCWNAGNKPNSIGRTVQRRTAEEPQMKPVIKF